MEIQKKIKAFTLFEIVITMMLAGIIVGIAYTAFNVFGRIYHAYSIKSAEISKILSLRKMLDIDMSSSTIVCASDTSIELKNPKKGLLTTYYVGRGMLLRTNHQLVDSFALDNLELKGLWEGKETPDGIVDQIILNFDLENRAFTISSVKRYSSEELIYHSDSLWNK